MSFTYYTTQLIILNLPENIQRKEEEKNMWNMYAGRLSSLSSSPPLVAVIVVLFSSSFSVILFYYFVLCSLLSVQSQCTLKRHAEYVFLCVWICVCVQWITPEKLYANHFTAMFGVSFHFLYCVVYRRFQFDNVFSLCILWAIFINTARNKDWKWNCVFSGI